MIKIERKGKSTNRIGEENHNNFGTLMKIVEYKDARDITVEFQDEYKEKFHTTYQHFKKGEVKNPYDKNVFGAGYIGVGKYKVIGKNKKPTSAYATWADMIKRCYDAYYINKNPTYIDCYVCNEWLNFQNFAEWYYKNIYNCNNERMHLDKDILIKGNKIYSPETCIIVPQRINSLFTKSDKARGEYPIGVSHYKGNDTLRVGCCIIDECGKAKRKHLGYFPLNKPFQAFYTYKIFKENYIKQIANEYKGMIPQKLYDAMYRYEVEIND